MAVSKTRVWIIGVVVAIAVALGLAAHHHSSTATGKPSSITVCNAGSLMIPLTKIAQGFEKEYSVKVLLEPSGSVEAVRKVTDLGINCDVVAVADYRLIPAFMVPRYADWYVAFAVNRMVIAYTPKSRMASVVEKMKNPLEVLSLFASDRSVHYGFSDPNRDPCGYRAVGVIGLVALETHNMSLLRDLVIDKIPGSSYRLVNGTLHIYIPASFQPRGNLVVRPDEVDLVSLLESGALDYAFEYQSLAVQHHLRYVALPDSVNLGDPAEASLYGRVVVHILVGTPKEKAIRMAPIVYGVTVPRNAEHAKYGLLFVEYMLRHGSVFTEEGQPFLNPPLGYGKLPAGLRSLVKYAGPAEAPRRS